jgi:integrase
VGIIRENPCRIKGYDRYHTPERPVATLAQVHALAGAVPARFSALILVAVFSGLRWGELAVLRRSDVNLTAGTVNVPRKLAALRDRWSSVRRSRTPETGRWRSPRRRWPRCARTCLPTCLPT